MQCFGVLTLFVCIYTLLGYILIEAPALLKLRWSELVKREQYKQSLQGKGRDTDDFRFLGIRKEHKSFFGRAQKNIKKMLYGGKNGEYERNQLLYAQGGPYSESSSEDWYKRPLGIQLLFYFKSLTLIFKESQLKYKLFLLTSVFIGLLMNNASIAYSFLLLDIIVSSSSFLPSSIFSTNPRLFGMLFDP